MTSLFRDGHLLIVLPGFWINNKPVSPVRETRGRVCPSLSETNGHKRIYVKKINLRKKIYVKKIVLIKISLIWLNLCDSPDLVKISFFKLRQQRVRQQRPSGQAPIPDRIEGV